MVKASKATREFIADWLIKIGPVLECISAGDFSKKLAVEKGDEFANLASALNTMIDDLSVSVKENIELVKRLEVEKGTLEDKVIQLEQFNKITVDRELRMVELKNELNRLEKQHSKATSLPVKDN